MAKLPVHRNQSGQALLLVLLVMSLVLVLVLSSVSRSVTDVEISQYEDKSVRAFDAAQAGIEKTVVGEAVSGETVDLGNGVTYVPTVSAAAAPGNFYKVPLNLRSGESATIFFVEHKLTANGDYIIDCPVGGCTSPNQMRICWGNTSSTDVPAVYLEFYYSADAANPYKWRDLADFSDISVATVQLDPVATRRTSNNFSQPNTTGGIPCMNNSTFAYRTLLTNTTTPLFPAISNILFVRITMLYNSTPQHLAIRTNAGSLPSQGSIISSIGKSDDVSRRLQLFQGYPEIPFEVGNSMYSKSGITK